MLLKLLQPGVWQKGGCFPTWVKMPLLSRSVAPQYQNWVQQRDLGEWPHFGEGFPSGPLVLHVGMIQSVSQDYAGIWQAWVQGGPETSGNLGKVRFKGKAETGVGCALEMELQVPWRRVPWQDSQEPFRSLTLGRWNRGKWGQQRWSTNNREHFFSFPARKRRCSLSVAQEWCPYQGKSQLQQCSVIWNIG